MPRKLAHVSAQKIAANRQNALKSTGPKTPKGKAHSRTNALKHGLFAMDMPIREIANTESSQQYPALLKLLQEDYEPVGIAEHLEVERIAACWWKLGRAWRYENAEIAYELFEVEMSRRGLMWSEEPISHSRLCSEHATLDLLRKAKTEVEATGKISDELKAEMAAADERFRGVWADVEKWNSEWFSRFVRGETSSANGAASSKSDPYTNSLLRHIGFFIDHLNQGVEAVEHYNTTNPRNRAAVPKGGALDRALRADAAAERNLGRAMDRLERRQRQRRGEAVPPPLSFRLTR
jgi:hypothetical protein